jgi:hypothetical protein
MATLALLKHTSMREQAYTPPETKYEVHIDELMKAIRGEDFVQGNGLYRIWGGEISEEKLFGQDRFFLYSEQKYIILTEAKLTGKGNINLNNINSNTKSLAFIIYKSIIPVINLWNATTKYWEFLNSEVSALNIENNSIVDRVTITNKCKFGHILIAGKSVTSDTIITNSQVKSIGIHNSEVRGLMITHNSLSGDIIVEKSKADRIMVAEDSHAGHIMIIESYLSNLIHIGDKSQAGDILINENSSIYKIGIAKNSLAEQIGISGNSKTDKIEITDNSQSNGITIQDRSVTGDISINNNREAMSISVTGKSQTGNLSFTDALLSQINIQGNYFSLNLHNTQFQVMKIMDSLIAEFNWQSGIKGELYVSQSYITLIRIANTTLLKESVLSVSDTQLQYILLEELLVQGSVLLRNISPATKIFDWRNINAYLVAEPEDIGIKGPWQDKFTLLEKQQKEYHKKVNEFEQLYGNLPIFRLSHCSLGKTEITASNLAGFRLEYYNSRLLECFIIGTSIPQKGIKIYSPFVPGMTVIGKEKYRQKLSLFTQLKKVFENQGDVIGTSVYHSIAMQSQEKLLSWRFWNQKDSLRNKVHYLFEKLGFFLNRASNNHGESWPRALAFTVILSIVFYFGSMWALKYDFDCTLLFNRKGYSFLTDFGLIKTYGERFFGFLNPTHGFDYMSKDTGLQPDFGHSCWDFFGRIFIGYGFFQFIAAFRRHGKKAG